MDLITCPLQSFAVCSNPYAAQAKIEKDKKDYAFRSNTLKYRGKEASWKITDNRNTIGLSRGKSDIYSKKLDIIGKGRQLTRDAVKEYTVSDSAVIAAQDGRSRKAGRNDYLALLRKTADIEHKIGNTLGRESAFAIQGINRKYMNKAAMNRQKLGLPPEYGAPVFERQASLWERTAPIREAVSFAMSFG